MIYGCDDLTSVKKKQRKEAAFTVLSPILQVSLEFVWLKHCDLLACDVLRRKKPHEIHLAATLQQLHASACKEHLSLPEAFPWAHLGGGSVVSRGSGNG